jgi:hypothetical protein
VNQQQTGDHEQSIGKTGIITGVIGQEFKLFL